MFLPDKDLIHKHSAHVASLNFHRIPRKIKKGTEDFNLIATFLFIRGEENGRIIYVNEAVEGWDAAVNIMSGLDKLPDAALYDLYHRYAEKYKGMKPQNISTFDNGETEKRTTYVLLREILWAHGDDTVKSLFWNR